MTGAEPIEDDGGPVVYRIDAADYLRSANAAWERFARENNGGELLARVQGTSLWQHIGGLEVRRIYRTLLERLRIVKGGSIEFPFRGDSPACRREMRMVITVAAHGGAEFRCQMLRQEPRAPIPLLDPAVPRSSRRVVVCAWCRRLHAHGEWMELEEAVAVSSLFDGNRWPYLDHDICPDCRALVC